MSPFCDLPHGLLVLLLAIPALSNALSSNNTGTVANTTSPFDPFEQLRLRASPQISEPICCLTPLSTEPLPTTAEFLSFEEWKSKQREIQAQAQAANQTPSPDAPAPESLPGSSVVASSTVLGDPDPPLPPPPESMPALSPHFRVPLTDRFNYASLDCSARVHTSHRAARSPAAILSSKKDKYMLSPCSTHPNFVVVELCDDIRIDTVQLANFEFFSGVFRDFKVSVAQTYTSDGQGWIEAGTYQAKNIRGVQSFHPLVELRPFYRYIRIDFLTHYGTEFYCPISLLRVYGLTQMEEWKWEVWQSGSVQGGPENTGVPALTEAEESAKIQAGAVLESPMSANRTPVTEAGMEAIASNETVSSADQVNRTQNALDNVVTTSDTEKHGSQTHTHQTLPLSTVAPLEASAVETQSTSNVSIPSQPATSPATVSDVPASGTPISNIENGSDTPVNNSSVLVTSPVLANAPSTTSSNISLSTAASTPGSSVQILVPLPSPSPIPSGESIYRTIMNRLAMLETNTTLYQKYVEEQTLQVREALRRLEEDVGRLEGISKAQQHVFSKTMNDLEMRRRQMEEERWQLLTKVNHLADEVVLEKRLGIAQLCLLLTVLVFMALTRGSRADAVSLLDGTMHRLNSFSRRPPWSNAEWTRKRWTSRSPTPTPTDFTASQTVYKKEARSVPIFSPGRQEKAPSSTIPFPTTPPARSQTPRSHLRRPSTPRHHEVSRLASSDRPTGRLRRSNSHTTPANIVLSAKRFARTAHLHEVQLSVRSRAKVSGSQGEGEGEGEAQSDEGGPASRDGSPRSRGKGKESPSSVRVLQDPITFSRRAPGGPESEAESWVDTELGSDSGPDSDSAESEAVGQEVEIMTEYSAAQSPIMSAPPSSLKKHLVHTPPSPASMAG